MAAPMTIAPVDLSAETIVARDVPVEQYLAQYAETFHEWVEGVVIKMSPVSIRHDLLTAYFRHLLDIYFELNPIGCVVGQPFVMRMDTLERVREPDLQIILNDNPGQLTPTAMIGPADLCIEVVSPESVERDYGQKFREYEAAGVREYWIIDPVRQRCDLNRLTDARVYAELEPDDSGHYHTPLLPRLALHVPTLWQDQLPSVSETLRAVQAMMAG
ncbi:MAG: Uma2 family endonuclease [Chloroflexi bacterium]|nr:Uma2 family endonuclease [Chloroflexota bacterium]